jgi:hypothetical protein
MRKQTKALKLNRDTLRLLEPSKLAVVAGNAATATRPCSFTACDGFGNSGCPNTCFC